MTLALLSLIRLVPYIIGFANAWAKGYRWLTIALGFVILVGMFNISKGNFDPSQNALAALFAFLIMMHTLNIKPRSKIK